MDFVTIHSFQNGQLDIEVDLPIHDFVFTGQQLCKVDLRMVRADGMAISTFLSMALSLRTLVSPPVRLSINKTELREVVAIWNSYVKKDSEVIRIFAVFDKITNSTFFSQSGTSK